METGAPKDLTECGQFFLKRMNRRRFLTYAVGSVALLGAMATTIPFVSSLNPSKRADALLPRIDLSSIEPGTFTIVGHPSLPEFHRGIAWSILLVKMKDGVVRAWTIPTKDNFVLIPDLHWWQPMTPCREFGPTKINGYIDEAAPIKCHDNDVLGWWHDKWQWSINGQNLSGQADNMDPTKGVIENGFFIVGKSS